MIAHATVFPMVPPLPPPPSDHLTEPRRIVFPTSGPKPDFSGDPERITSHAAAESRPRGPIVFPSSGEAPVTRAHQDLRTDLYLTARRLFAQAAWIGSNQYVYYDASDPSKWVAPDLLVRRGGPNAPFASWKVWDRGAPELAIEIVREEEATVADWAAKRAKYHAVGVEELVRFEAESDSPLRVWDRVEGDLVERRLRESRATSRVLGLDLVVVGSSLRLERDGVMVPTPDELARIEGERATALARRADEEARRADRLRAELIAAGIDPEG